MGKIKAEKQYTREINTSKMCDLLGGKYDPYNNSCTFLKEEEVKLESVTDSPKYTVFYVMQIFIGTSVSFFTILFRGSPPRISAYWYVNLAFLVMASVFFVFSDWYRDGEMVESVKRSLLILTTFVIASILIKTFMDFGTIFNSTYWIPSVYFNGEPIVVTTVSMFTATLLNVFIKPWTEVAKAEEAVKSEVSI